MPSVQPRFDDESAIYPLDQRRWWTVSSLYFYTKSFISIGNRMFPKGIKD